MNSALGESLLEQDFSLLLTHHGKIHQSVTTFMSKWVVFGHVKSESFTLPDYCKTIHHQTVKVKSCYLFLSFQNYNFVIFFFYNFSPSTYTLSVHFPHLAILHTKLAVKTNNDGMFSIHCVKVQLLLAGNTHIHRFHNCLAWISPQLFVLHCFIIHIHFCICHVHNAK